MKASKLNLLSCLLASVMLSVCASAQSYIVVDAHTSRVLLAQDTERRRPVAGMAKIAASMVALDWASVAKEDLNQLVTVPVSSVNFGGKNPLQLQVGERLSLRDAIYSGLLGDDDVSMHALSYHVGSKLLAHRQRAGEPVGEFVREMGQFLKFLGLKRTQFYSAHGMELAGESGYSTASDLAILSIHAMKDPGFTYYVKQKTRPVTVYRRSGKKESYSVKTSNPLLGQLGVIGGKTALSSSAGSCLMVASDRDSIVKKYEGGKTTVIPRRLISVLLRSADSHGETRVLLREGERAYDLWASQGYVSSPSRKEYLK